MPKKIDELETGNRPKISILMPIYNEGELLCEALESYFAQTISEDCELICIDDGSTDESLTILNLFLTQYQKDVVVIRQENLGSGMARNNGIDAARGEFIGFLDADDLYPSDRVLETLYKAARENSVYIAGGSMQSFDAINECLDFSAWPELEGQTFKKSGIIKYSDYQFDYGYQRFIYKRSFLLDNDIRFPNYLRYQDPPFFIHAMIMAKEFYAISEHTYKYRETSQGIVWNDQKAFDMISGMTEVGIMAAKYNYEHLFRLNLSRLNNHWHPTFYRLIFEEGRTQILGALYKAKHELLNTETELEVRNLLAQTPAVEADIPILMQRLIESNTRIEEILMSTTWKTGSAITWLPRKIRNWMRRG
jgi:glycosyltransferase involved in cell wall biosynthesis